MLYVEYNSGYPSGMMLYTVVWAILFGYFALGYDSDPDSCMATTENDVKVGSDHPNEVDVGAKFRMSFEIIFYCLVA